MTIDISDLDRQLQLHRAVDQREVEAVSRIRQELQRLAAPFDEHGDPVHVTGSAIITGTRGVVLHLHKRLGIWIQPGGHLEPGEDPWEAALRESVEETGLAVRHPPSGPRLVHVDVHDGGRGHTHLDLRYLLVADDADPAPGPGESQQVAWFSWDDALAMADPGLIGALRVLRPS